MHGLEVVSVEHGIHERCFNLDLLCKCHDGVHILGEAGPSESASSVQEHRIDPEVQPDPLHNLVHVNIELLADPGELVGEGDLGGKQGVRRIFDKLGSLDLDMENGDRFIGIGLVVPVDVVDDLSGLFIVLTDDDTVRIQAVMHRLPLSQELRVHDQSEINSRLLAGILLNDGEHQILRSPGYHRALGGHHMISILVPDGKTYLLGDHLNCTQVRRAIREGRGPHTDEGDVRLPDGLDVVQGRTEHPPVHLGPHELLQPGLIERRLPVVQPLDLRGCRSGHNGPETVPGIAHRACKANIAHSQYRNPDVFHGITEGAVATFQ